MKAALQITFMSAVLFLFSACASTYKPLRPETLSYTTGHADGPVDFKYRFNILQESGNKKYAKDERRKNIQLVAVEFTNEGETPVKFSELEFSSNGRLVEPLPTTIVSQKIKQGVIEYALYGLLFVYVSNNGSDGSVETTNYPVGAAIGLGNIIVAASANSKFKNELYQYELQGKTIQPGETIHALVGFRNLGYSPLEVKVDKVDRVL